MIHFKKIASVLASAVMLSSTVALAAATVYPAPFVKNGSADVAVVWGANAQLTDYAAVLDVTSDLQAELATQTKSTGTSSGGTSTVSGGDFKQLAKSTNKFNLGESLNSVYASLDKDELSTVLADGVYEDDDGTEYDYDQTITLGTATLTHFEDGNVNADEKPVIGFDISSGVEVFNYTLDFKESPVNSSSLLETTNLKMLGRTYYISNVEAASNSSTLKLTLLDTANSATVYEGEPVTVTVGNQSYEVAVVSTDGTNSKATLSVNGKKLDSINEGNSRKIAPNTYLSVLDLFEGSREKDVNWVEFSIGTGQIILEGGEKLQVNEDSVDGIDVTIGNSGNKLNSISLTWTTQDEQYLVPGMDLVLPGFETVKLSMGDFVTAKPENLEVRHSGNDYMELRDLNLKSGKISSFPLLYTNGTATGFKGLGKDSTNVLLTSATANPSFNLVESNNTRFFATWKSASGDDWESYAFELDSVSAGSNGVDNKTKLRNLADGSTIEFSDADDKDVGEVTLTTSAVNGNGGTATIALSSSSGSVYADRVITKEGLQFKLPVINVTSAVNPLINITSGAGTNTSNPSSWRMDFTEADKDNNAALGSTFNITLGHTTSNGPQVSSVSLNTLPIESSSDDEEGYVSGSNTHATKILYKTGGDQDTAEITYHGDEAFAEVFVSETGVTVSAGNGTTTTGSTVKTLGTIAFKDNEAASFAGKNLIVVGGSCVNSVAAQLLGGPLCGADFTKKTGVGAGSFLIETFNQSNGKIATLVAGYNAGDTTAAAKYFTTQNADTTSGVMSVKTVQEVTSLI